MFSRLSRSVLSSSRVTATPGAAKRLCVAPAVTQCLMTSSSLLGTQAFSTDTTDLGYTPKYDLVDINEKTPCTRPDLGHHLMMTFASADPHLVNSAQRLVDEVSPILERHGCSIVNVKPQQFEPMGATVVWTLAESHFSIHTWPEHHTCVIDFFTCQLNADEICALVREDLIDLFGARNKPDSILESIMIPRGRRMVQANLGEMEGQVNNMLLFTDELLFEKHSKYQHVKVVDTGKGAYGKILLLDGIIQISEVTDHYSVAMSTPVIEADGLDNLLIIGGGDCKIAKSLLKHHSDKINNITIVDIDEIVTEATLAHFEHLQFTEAESKQVAMHFEDAAKWIERQVQKIIQGEAKAFSGCIIDCTDPAPAGGVSRSLFTSEFYSNLSQALKPGSMVTQQYSHHEDLEPELIHIREAGYENILAKECQQLEYQFPLNVVQATTGL